MLWGAWMALVAAHAQGVAFVLSILCLVWMADIAAYFGGHAFGRRKLAPSISPGKSWEGVWSGMGAVLVLAWAWVSLIGEAGSPSLFSVLFDRFGWMWGSVMLLLLSGVSVVGDLFESLVKRAAGAKDSSRLLPGHGGVLDRIDALLPVFPLALALCAS
jgi:phosphatidate cytidylyltransferase